MGFLVQATRTKIFNEFSNEEREKYFSIKTDKVLHNIDTLYFSVSLKNDNVDIDNVDIKKFITDLNLYKTAEKTEQFWFDFDLELLYKDISFGFYKHCLSRTDMFDIFICNTIPNNFTPRVVVQIRSSMLWSLGDSFSINYILDILDKLFKIYNLEINEIKENRIDYAFHTNSLQNTEKYFSDEFIKNNVDTTFQIGSKVFRKDKKSLNVEYLSFGNRKSNNLFFRTYNKTLEVIELNYKSFFLDIWLSHNLISKYDYDLLTYCYENGSYNKKYEFMVKFYIEFGKDENLKLYLNNLLKSETATIDNFRSAVKGLCPEHTRIQNFEFQTMRKFYLSGSDLIDTLPIINNCDFRLLRLYRILDNRKIFLDYLTSKTLVFNDKNNSVCRFWRLIQKCKLDKTIQVNYKRNYKTDTDINLILNKLKSNLATYSVYKDKIDSDLVTDFCEVLNTINDNDMKEFERYSITKNKKAKALKSIKTLKTLADNDKL